MLRKKFDIRRMMRTGSSDVDELALILKEAHIFDPRLLYRAVAGLNIQWRLEQLKRKGTDYPQYDTIYALTHDEVFCNPPEITLFDYFDSGSPSAIAVYDASQLVPMRSLIGEDRKGEIKPLTMPNMYRFKDPSHKKKALLAIIE